MSARCRTQASGSTMGHPVGSSWPALVLGLIVAIVGVAGVAGSVGAIEVGSTAPDFSLPSTTGGKLTLSQFRGKKLVLIEFYGADASPT